jgi:phosphohistidine phosphatase SixA
MKVASKDASWCLKIDKGGGGGGGGKKKKKKKGIWAKKKKKNQKLILTSYNLESTFTCQIFSSKAPCKKEEIKKTNPNEVPKSIIQQLYN